MTLYRYHGAILLIKGECSSFGHENPDTGEGSQAFIPIRKNTPQNREITSLAS